VRHLSNSIIIIPLLLCFFLIGVTFDKMGFQAFSFLALGLTLAGIIAAPLQASLIMVIVFIWFQGFLKIVSNYHPFIHVGADAVVIALLFKVLFKNKGQRKKPPPLTWLFALHFAWVFIILFNPYSLSLVSSIAGSKVYISMFLLYFFGYYLVNNLKDVQRLFVVFAALAAVQTVFTIYQGLRGPSSVLSLHPGFQIPLAKMGSYAFRPFGLTHIPGGPSVYIYMVLPILTYFIYYTRSVWLRFFSASLLPLIGVALFMCQIRSAIGKAVIAMFVFIVTLTTSNVRISFARRFSYIAGSAILASFALFAMFSILGYSAESFEDNERTLARSLSTFDLDAMANARRGSFNRFLKYASDVPFGAGFSRVGAAAGAFPQLQKNDPHFPVGYFFSDNLFVLLVIEIGIPGLLIVVAMILSILYIGFRIWRTEERQQLLGPQMAIFSSLVAIAAGSYGAEGIVYNPESCFFWLFAGVMMAMRDPKFAVQAS
jgi:O-antigen ligase